MNDLITIEQAIVQLKQGNIIAYPTEAVYGLGCDPSNEDALMQLIQLKNRPMHKGFILIAESWAQLQAWVKPIPSERLQEVLATWPGPYTWIFPAADHLSSLVMGEHQQTIAVRVSNHPVAKALCEKFNSPLVSTSANISEQQPARDIATVKHYFPSLQNKIVEGELGKLSQPTMIRDALTSEIVRA